MAAKAKKKEAAEWMYEIISHPHVTEKSTLGLRAWPGHVSCT